MAPEKFRRAPIYPIKMVKFISSSTQVQIPSPFKLIPMAENYAFFHTCCFKQVFPENPFYLLNDSLQKVIICVVQPSPQMDNSLINRTIWRPSWITKLLIEMSQCNSYIKNWWYITIYWKCHSFFFSKMNLIFIISFNFLATVTRYKLILWYD